MAHSTGAPRGAYGGGVRVDETRIALPGGDRVSASLGRPARARPGTFVVLAHGAGTDRTDGLLRAVQASLGAVGVPALLFNFPYRERGRWPPDRHDVLLRCYRAVVTHVRDIHAPLRIVVGGRSLGGRIASHLAAEGAPVAGVVCLAFPLHPARRPAIAKAAHLARLAVPLLVVQGTRDALADPHLLHEALAPVPDVTLHEVADADHAFRLPRRAARTATDVQTAIVAAVVSWIGRLG